MPVKFALAALVASVAAQSEALVVWLSLPAPFFAALAPVGEWNTHFELFLSRIDLFSLYILFSHFRPRDALMGIFLLFFH